VTGVLEKGVKKQFRSSKKHEFWEEQDNISVKTTPRRRQGEKKEWGRKDDRPSTRTRKKSRKIPVRKGGGEWGKLSFYS